MTKLKWSSVLQPDGRTRHELSSDGILAGYVLIQGGGNPCVFSVHDSAGQTIEYKEGFRNAKRALVNTLNSQENL